MWQNPPVLQHVSRLLKNRLGPITEAPLPKRWVELIHYLDEKERREAQSESESPRTTSNRRLIGTCQPRRASFFPLEGTSLAKASFVANGVQAGRSRACASH
jgi:hypothetical protein